MTEPLRKGEEGRAQAFLLAHQWERSGPAQAQPLAQRSVAQIQTHSLIMWNDTFIGVSWGKRLMVTEPGPGPTRSGFQPQGGQWVLLLWSDAPPPLRPLRQL